MTRAGREVIFIVLTIMIANAIYEFGYDLPARQTWRWYIMSPATACACIGWVAAVLCYEKPRLKKSIEGFAE